MRRTVIVCFVLLAGLLMVMSASASRAAKENLKPSNGILGKVVPVNEEFRGMTYTGLTMAWWQWDLNQPEDPTKVFDPVAWLENQPDKVWFLAGMGNYETPVRQSINIPPDVALFFPIIDSAYIGWPQWPYNEIPEMGWGTVIPRIDAVIALHCVIDGVEVPNLFQYRADSGGFPDWSGEVNMIAEGWQTKFLPDDLYPGPYPIVADGYWLLLRPLSAGKHTIQIKGECGSGVNYWGPFKGYTIDVTYDITVGKTKKN